MPTWEIYIATNQITGLQYVGITTRGVERRWRGHLSDAKKCRYGAPFHEAIRKYGEDAFTLTVACTCTTANAACHAEKTLIRILQTYHPSGYNATRGGQGYAGPHKAFSAETLAKMRAAKVGKKLTPSHKLAIGAAHRGRKQSPEWIEKRAQAHRGKQPPPMSQDTKAKLSQALKGRIVSDKTRKKIGDANRGRKHSQAVRAARSSAMIGKPSQQRTNAKSGLRGAYKSGNVWFSHIKVRRKKHYLGTFPTAEAAHAAYREAAIRAFGENARLD